MSQRAIVAVAALAGVLVASVPALVLADSRKPKGPVGKTPPAGKTPTPTEPPKPFPTGTDKRRIIGILDVRIDGAPPEVGAQFQRDLESQVDIKHYFLAPRIRMHDLMANSTKWTEGCVVGSCLKEIKSQTNADVVLLAALTGSGTSFGWVVTLVRTDTGNVLGQKTERCDVCTVSEALSAATLATVDLLTTIPEVLPDEHPAPAPIPASTSPALETKLHDVERHQKRTAMVFTLVGLAIAAAGTALYFADSSHPKYGLATAAGGAGMAVGGVVLLTF